MVALETAERSALSSERPRFPSVCSGQSEWKRPQRTPCLQAHKSPFAVTKQTTFAEN